jgi:hypothetical protein
VERREWVPGTDYDIIREINTGGEGEGRNSIVREIQDRRLVGVVLLLQLTPSCLHWLASILNCACLRVVLHPRVEEKRKREVAGTPPLLIYAHALLVQSYH